MHALVPLCIIHYTKFEVPRFTNSKDMIGGRGQNLNKLAHMGLTVDSYLLSTSKSRDTKSRKKIRP